MELPFGVGLAGASDDGLGDLEDVHAGNASTPAAPTSHCRLVSATTPSSTA
jgi:hypothetical protein